MVKYVESLDEFNALVAASTEKLLVVDFTASWCGPCQMIAPTFEKMAKEHTDVTFIKVDVDEAEEIAAQAGVRAMPTFMFYKDGKKVADFAGANVSLLKDHVIKYK
mmetsp:Transcript_29131/g.45272  ORF Transcript_29131/g.45272 Transcript_29131/m.45272 type:complete len:106 (+) Transcript_29131:112-429(+)|eukprot:CAMPEP_0196801570 /NCGR_PEP_ID=MMETSP1362-20130617/1344_1 /TAXON_ID=163516 /ORGANISM="Leptocylindrus danicus, Strain CCMP1856" /LENGTH=105 /DNA_ID=CAMNT_0042172601 /DNA_START=112 /DNA_END=429 /DNA_ORIENTATION=+